MRNIKFTDEELNEIVKSTGIKLGDIKVEEKKFKDELEKLIIDYKIHRIQGIPAGLLTDQVIGFICNLNGFVKDLNEGQPY